MRRFCTIKTLNEIWYSQNKEIYQPFTKSISSPNDLIIETTKFLKENKFMDKNLEQQLLNIVEAKL